MNCEFNEDLFEELSAKAIAVMQRINELNDGEWSFDQQNSRATSLLNAIEYRPPVSLDREIRRALSEFLDNEELKERIVTATAEAVKEVISGCLSKDMSDIYLPTMERSHRRLSRHMARVLTDAFERYENSAMFMKHTHRASRALRRSLEQHELLLKTSNPAALHQVVHDTIGQFLKTELKEWRQKVLEMLTTEPEDEPEEPSPSMLPTTPQPADPEISLVDQLMRTAVINKFIEDGDVNGAFSNALSASDLSLVMTACRGADPATVFTQPCLLEQSVLLSLIQQLATDLVHETQLKCRYLEDALINLNLTDPNTMAHLPMVVGDVRKHLMKFLHAYPSHAASRRVALIVMAVDNLPK
ncbi:enhancer of mRNA-decapping protein 4 [Amyelois transitella]|uniref:enhancer of mRNA-decapping protein 4 n=1 Tax=Amyelois transitella TaxID=680683 RepID=UPI0029901BC4|nr:enhancer of mRNA-decapping protein 4 [Amyelois transitella]